MSLQALGTLRQCLRPQTQAVRSICHTRTTLAQDKVGLDDPDGIVLLSRLSNPDGEVSFASLLGRTPGQRNVVDEMEDVLRKVSMAPPPSHRLNVYSHKHNTHICFTHPNGNPIISKSSGNIGFRKAQRGTYEAAFQLSSYVFAQMHEKGLIDKISGLDVVMRGFGNGREAISKALLGVEGRRLRPLITRIGDSTRLKFGGTRGKKPRRL